MHVAKAIGSIFYTTYSSVDGSGVRPVGRDVRGALVWHATGQCALECG